MAVPEGGEHFTARPSRRSSQPDRSLAGARPRTGRASGAARPRDDGKLNAYVKEVVDSLPPLTDAQRDLLALIFRNRHK
jgi:hypothetical protein